jgi:hypothetical protein
MVELVLSKSISRTMGYDFEIFLSYRRSSTVGPWVRNHLHPKLLARIEEISAIPIRISLDADMPGGVVWPDDLKLRLRSSAILLTVWSADYFRSDWCMAEWRSFREREARLGFATAANPRGLVYPIRYADGKYFHDEAKQTQIKFDFSDMNYPEEEFRRTQKYLDFDDRVKGLAADLLPLIEGAPNWQHDFPIVEPAPMAPVQIPRAVI